MYIYILCTYAVCGSCVLCMYEIMCGCIHVWVRYTYAGMHICMCKCTLIIQLTNCHLVSPLNLKWNDGVLSNTQIMNLPAAVFSGLTLLISMCHLVSQLNLKLIGVRPDP